MRAMVMERSGSRLREMDVPVPVPAAGEVLLKVAACGVCRTDLHIVDGELPDPRLPLIPGHEIVGTVVEAGEGAIRFAVGDRVGVPWLGATDGVCEYCRTGRENLCDHPVFTGYTRDGGYAEYVTANEQFCFPIPAMYSDEAAAPLLCAGLIGYRSLMMAGDGARLGIYGFGAAAHIVAQVARSQGRSVYAFTRSGDTESQEFARSLGAVWAGASTEMPPDLLHAAIIFAPVGPLVPKALTALRKGGVVVCAGIHMSDIPTFPYHILWEERSICSVANLTRNDGSEFFAMVERSPVETDVQTYPLAHANEALADLREGRIQGAAVLAP